MHRAKVRKTEPSQNSCEARLQTALDSFKSLLQDDFSNLFAELAHRKNKLETILNGFSCEVQVVGKRRRPKAADETVQMQSVINVGGDGFQHPNMTAMKGLLDSNDIDKLRCLLHPMWAPFMIRDKTGKIYLDIDMEWMGELLDQVMDAEMNEPSTAYFKWQSYEARGFRHLKLPDKVGYQLVRCFFSLGLEEKHFDQHLPSTTKQQLPPKLNCGFLVNYYSDFSRHWSCGGSNDALVWSVIVDSEVHHVTVQKQTLLPSLQHALGKFFTPFCVFNMELLAVKKAPALSPYHYQYNHQVLLDPPAESMQATMVLEGALNILDSERSWIRTSKFYSSLSKTYVAVASPPAGQRSTPEPGLVIGKSASEMLLQLDVNNGKISFSGDLGVRLSMPAIPARVVAIYPVLVAPINPLLYTQLQRESVTLRVSAAIRQRKIEDENEDEEDGEEDNEDDEAGEADGSVAKVSPFRQGRARLDSLEAEYNEWRCQLDCREYIMLVYARFMRDYLFDCYGIPIPQRDSDKLKDGGVTRDNMLQHVEAYLQDISEKCVLASHEQPLVYLNVGGMKLTVLRSSILRRFPDSQLAVRISGRWKEQPGDMDEDGYIVYNLPKKPFKALISYIRAYSLNQKLAKLFIEEEHQEALRTILNYLTIPAESIPICVV